MTEDSLGCDIANRYVEWENARQVKVAEWKEIQQYIFATDTTKTTNSKLEWSNKTTLPKLCQVRDNLHANYLATMFPRRGWLEWEGSSPADEDADKKRAIKAYMNWALDRNQFYTEASRLVLDYIDYGNCFATVEWIDQSNADRTAGYVGPILRRISPLDIVFNPTSPSFVEAPKIIRSLISIGEVKAMIETASYGSEEEKLYAHDLYAYMKELRARVSDHTGNAVTKDDSYRVSGFDSYRSYLESNTVEVLTFYGDVYDEGTDTFLRNHVVKVVDRHRILSKHPNPSFFGTAPIYSAGWRLRPDNVWSMGPLDNLVGMQYRIDHLENLKADCFDIIAAPVLKIKGTVEDFNWAPMARIYVGDDGDVTLLSPDVQALQADNQIAILEQKIEEMSGSPKEAMGFRSPGEKTMYEVQRLENAASRVFQNKIAQIERDLFEPAYNGMLELARRNLTSQTIRIFDNEIKIAVFENLTANDLTGSGRIRPIAARHFSERATQLQNLNNFFASAVGADQEVRAHFSSIEIARLYEELLELDGRNIVQPYIRLSEQGDAQRLMDSQAMRLHTESQTPAGIFPGDHDEEEAIALNEAVA